MTPNSVILLLIDHGNILLLHSIKKQPVQNRELMKMTKKTSPLEERVYNNQVLHVFNKACVDFSLSGKIK